MSLYTEIEASERHVKETESRINSIKDGLTSVEREIILLTLKELALKDNMKILRKTPVIVLVSEFKRSKEDLNRTQTRLGAKTDALAFLAKSKEKLEELKASEVSNVLEFKAKSTN